MNLLILWFALFWFIMFVFIMLYTLHRQKCNNCDNVRVFSPKEPYCSKCGKNNLINNYKNEKM